MSQEKKGGESMAAISPEEAGSKWEQRTRRGRCPLAKPHLNGSEASQQHP